jgi:hypothetical protein
MNSNRYLVCIPAALLMSIGWLILALAWPEGSANRHLMIGLMLGTMFGHTTVAAGWSAFGPGPLILRMPLSAAMVAMCVLIFTASIFVRSRGEVGLGMVLAGCLLAQWTLVQVPLWILGISYGIRMRHREDAQGEDDRRARQFGIRQLLIATTVLAVVLAIGRFVVLNADGGIVDGEALIFALLGVAAVLMSLPLLMAALLPRYSVVAVAVVSLLIAVGTFFELPLLQRFQGSGPETVDLIWINLCTSLWIVAFVTATRLSGYGIAQARTRQLQTSKPSDGFVVPVQE